MKKRSGRASRHADEVTAEEAEEAFEGEWSIPLLKLSELRRKIGADPVPTTDGATRRLKLAKEVQRDPKRFFLVTQNGDLLDRSVILIDLLVPEAIELAHRSVGLMNSFSMAGVEWVRATKEAEAWLRTRLSGRKMKGGGLVVDSPAKPDRSG